MIECGAAFSEMIGSFRGCIFALHESFTCVIMREGTMEHWLVFLAADKGGQHHATRIMDEDANGLVVKSLQRSISRSALQQSMRHHHQQQHR